MNITMSSIVYVNPTWPNPGVVEPWVEIHEGKMKRMFKFVGGQKVSEGQPLLYMSPW